MTGKVYLVGAGPGDPELLTFRAAHALAQADAVIIDDLVHRGCLRHAKPGFQLIPAGKRGGCRSTPQVFIERLMVRLAKRGSVVVRLKGGDPFVFGRGGEELDLLRRQGIEVEVIPGVTAGIGVPGRHGLPVTHRGLSRGVTFISGHRPDHSWDALRAGGTTIVVYMGMARLAELVSHMLAAGFAADTPACAIQDGTLDSSRQFVGTLAALPGCGLASPAIVIIGEVVRLAAWKADESLDRRRVG